MLVVVLRYFPYYYIQHILNIKLLHVDYRQEAINLKEKKGILICDPTQVIVESKMIITGGYYSAISGVMANRACFAHTSLSWYYIFRWSHDRPVILRNQPAVDKEACYGISRYVLYRDYWVNAVVKVWYWWVARTLR